MVLNERNIFLTTVPNAITPKWPNLKMRPKSSSRSRTQACGKTPAMETVAILRQKNRRFTQSELKTFSHPAHPSSFFFILTLYVFVILPSLPYSTTLEFPNVTPLSGKRPHHRLKHDLKLPSSIVRREDLVKDLRMSLNCLLSGNVTCRLPYRLY